MGRSQATRDSTLTLRIGSIRLRHVERAGWIVGGAALGLGIAGLNSGNNVLYLVTGFILATVILASLFSRRALRSLALQMTLPPSAWAGENTAIRVQIRNMSRWWPLVHTEIFTEWWGPEGSSRPVRRRSAGYRLRRLLLLPGHTRRAHLIWRFPTRGCYRLCRVIVGSNGPFGWFYRWGWVTLDRPVVVYPPRWPRWEYSLRQLVGEARPATLHRLGGGEEFWSLRPYQSGDPLRWIHWPTSARTGHWHVRQWTQPLWPAVWWILDRRMSPEDLERALSWTATGLWEWTRRGESVGFLTQDLAPVVIITPRDLHRVLRFLAVCRPSVAPIQKPSPGFAGLWISAPAFPPPSPTWHWIRTDALTPERAIYARAI